MRQLVYDRVGDGAEPAFLDQIGLVQWADEDGTRAVLPGRLDLDSLVYFGLSVVWRASVATTIPQCSLGAHEDDFRRYLLRTAPFPSHTACVIAFSDLPLSDGKRINSVASFPNSDSDDGFTSHAFVVFGLRYFIATGELPDWVTEFCAINGPQRWILLTRQEDLLNHLRPAFEAAVKFERNQKR